jgi:DNA repair exonuclease SbcCD ATPase subunit
MPRKQKELTTEEVNEALRDIDERENESKKDIADIEADLKKLNGDSVKSLCLSVTFQVLKDTLEDLKDELKDYAKERTKLLKLADTRAKHSSPNKCATEQKIVEPRK